MVESSEIQEESNMGDIGKSLLSIKNSQDQEQSGYTGQNRDGEKGRSPTSAEEEKSGPKSFILYKYRHFELTIYCFATMINQITWISL